MLNVLCRFCAEECQRTGCINSTCFSNCRQMATTDGLQNVSSYVVFMGMQLLDWKMWDCASECEYQCMIQRESERQLEGLQPVQYHGKWPFKRFFKLQVCSSHTSCSIACISGKSVELVLTK